jgi:hypothetical protein
VDVAEAPVPLLVVSIPSMVVVGAPVAMGIADPASSYITRPAVKLEV